MDGALLCAQRRFLTETILLTRMYEVFGVICSSLKRRMCTYTLLEVGQEQLGLSGWMGELILRKAGEIGFFEKCRNSLF